MRVILLLLLMAGCTTRPEIDSSLDAALMTPEQRCEEGRTTLAKIDNPTREEKLLAIGACLR